jgi:hypothetical protein
MNTRTEKQLEATEVWSWRRMLKVSWTETISKEDILKQVNEKMRLVVKLRKKQSRFLGHILKKGNLENIETAGKVIGRQFGR